MHIAKALIDSVSLFHDDYEWVQTIDYEHIPFHCRKCHEHGHLFRDFPLNLQSKNNVMEARKDAEGFTKVPNEEGMLRNPLCILTISRNLQLEIVLKS